MSKNLKKTAGTMTENNTPLSQLPSLKLVPQNGQHLIDFDTYRVFYSIITDSELAWGPWAWFSGETFIECFKDEEVVGFITFYKTSEIYNGGYIDDSNSRILLEYPIERFKDIMYLLKTYNSLVLMFRDTDPTGKLLDRPYGALISNESKPIGE